MMLPRKTRCATCPFRRKGWTEVREFLSMRALNEATPVCHSSGPDALKRGRHWLRESHACRGARDLQLRLFAGIGFISEATDAAWAAKAKELGL